MTLAKDFVPNPDFASDKDENPNDENTLTINRFFSNDDLDTTFYRKPLKTKKKYALPEPSEFEIVELPDGREVKLAYNKFFPKHLPDLEIELSFIQKYEGYYREAINHQNRLLRIKAFDKLRYHYKKVIPYFSPRMAAGWSRWSEEILELFLSHKLHKILWGSGGCGKSAMYGLLLYIKWRVRPDKRMVVIASRVMKEAGARVFSYIKEIHANAPESYYHNFRLSDTADGKAIYCLIKSKSDGKMVTDDRACIINLPVKVSAKNMDLGGNLLGKHPEELLVLAFDEGQEMPGNLVEMKIFLNWYTNPNVEIHAWGNPIPVEFHNPESWDLLFKLGAGHLGIATLRKLEKRADKTDKWSTLNTDVLRLSMLDSPKDDPDEVNNFIVREGDGTRHLRLAFLGGRDTVKIISENTTPKSPSWYSQVLGFPYIDFEGEKNQGCLTPFLMKEAQKYPLIWKSHREKLEWFMGIDPSLTGRGDDCAIVCGSVGTMLDGRRGVDLAAGKYCRKVMPLGDDEAEEEFADTTIEVMWAIAKELKIPLRNIAIETHSIGEVFRYALNKHIEDGKWANDKARGENYHVVNPMQGVTDRLLFKQLGKLRPAKEMCLDFPTELWLGVRCGVMNRQIFNMPEYIQQEFFRRLLLVTSNMTKYKIEQKEVMKKRGVRSPSFADATCNMLEIMRIRGKFSYKYYNRAAYTEKFGAAYDQVVESRKVQERMGAVSEMLGVQFNLGEGRKSKLRSAFDIDAV